ncbi:hypothetical protein J2S43_002368 [Catenuloplanes nepalensis]|uniref:DUF4034 domain-containing protein n=1 Tax=Catenuloplanes nepalensis TaxID=587533 RepID=A0ABT9MQZ2_9ACTN|nr:hypothetical protein [Catenuloplanes nepalensis]MDP9793856.1 hypothetical protein [Catenuloplanes nepalensis]
MLSRLFRRGPRPAPPVIDADRAMDDLVLRAARDTAHRTGDWTALRDVVAETGTDWERRTFRLRVLGEDASTAEGAWLDDWQEREPDDPAAALIYAEALDRRAGKARGGASARNTTREQFAEFQALSAQSVAAGRRALDLAGPDDPSPLILLLNGAFAARTADTPEFDAQVAEALRRSPYHFELHLTLVSLYCEKWFGSHSRMFEAARTVAAAAPDGANAVMLPYLAHFEYAMREFGWDRRDKHSLAAAADYFRRPEVQDELDTWAAKWQAGAPHPPGRAMTCRHWLALAAFLGRRKDLARATFDEIGTYHGATVAWGYFLPGAGSGFLAAWEWAHD